MPRLVRQRRIVVGENTYGIKVLYGLEISKSRPVPACDDATTGLNERGTGKGLVIRFLHALLEVLSDLFLNSPLSIKRQAFRLRLEDERPVSISDKDVDLPQVVTPGIFQKN